MNKFSKWLFCLFLLITQGVVAQDTVSVNYMPIDYNHQEECKIVSMEVVGNKFTDKNLIIFSSGLSFGQTITIPGTAVSQAILNLWNQNLFSNVRIYAKKIEDGEIYLIIEVTERPLLFGYSFRGIGNSEQKKLRDEISLKRGMVINEDLINRTKSEIQSYYYEKGYYNADVDIIRIDIDTIPNNKLFRIAVNKGRRVKVSDIEFVGNENLSDAKLRAALKKTKRKRGKLNIFASAKFIEKQYKEELNNVLLKYNTLGYRDASLTFDSVVRISKNRVAIKVGVNEGNQYFFRHITFTGNNKYTSEQLTKVLNIKKGDIYDQSVLEERIFFSPNGTDISSLYMDDGYLFFGVTPVEVKVENDSIDIEIRIIERTQAVYDKIIVKGNTKTSDHVVLRELRTRPGQKFSRSDIQRSIRELSQLGFFDPQSLAVNPIPNPQTGTVDIEYTVVEKANDQIELSGGWGGSRANNAAFGNSAYGYGGLVGTLGLTLNNFSTRKLFKPSLWNPLPSGDGQKLSIRAQSNGLFYQSYNFSFTEPWFGGKRPNSFTTSLFKTNQSFDVLKNSDPAKNFIRITGVSLSLGKRLKWPDDYFNIFYSLSFQQYNLKNANGAFGLLINTGKSNNAEMKLVLSRNSSNDLIFPTNGSNYSLSTAFTPPVSILSNKDYSTLSISEKFKWIEYHKWKFDVENYMPLNKKFVLATKLRFGYLGYYNRDIGLSPFERFMVGGSGLNSFGQIGTEIISMRGYPDRSITENAAGYGNSQGAAIFNKFTCELRYPITNSPNASIFLLGFAEAGNAWVDARTFNPFDLKRSAGGGVRLFLPMFGLLGLDYAYGFDNKTIFSNLPLSARPKAGQWHFFIGQQF